MRQGGAPDRQLLLVRALWLLIAAVGLIALVLAAPSQFAAIRDGQGPNRLSESAFAFYRLTAVELGLLEEAGGSTTLYAAYLFGMEILWLMAFFAPAALIFWRRFDEPIGRLAAFALMLMGIYALPSQSLGAASFEQFPNISYGGLIGFVLLIPFAYSFPDGRFHPRWTLGPTYLASAAIVSLFLLFHLRPLTRGVDVALLLLVFLANGLLTFRVQVYRIQKISTPVERQQSKWVLFGLIGSALGNILLGLSVLLEPDILQPGTPRLLYLLAQGPISVATMSLIPLTIALSIIRFRLWDIDLVIRRTLIYGTLTATLALVYFSSVFIFQRLIPAQSEVAVVASTLAIATLFTPLRSRIQRAIDRRFYRQTYDAELILRSFGRRLRDEVDLDRISDALLTAAADSLQPTKLSLWLHGPAAETLGDRG